MASGSLYVAQPLLRRSTTPVPCCQELLRTCGKPKGHASNTLLEQMAADVQPLLRPYLESKYALKSVARQPEGVVFSPDLGFRRWLSRWMKQMVAYYATGGHTAQACLTTAAHQAVLEASHRPVLHTSGVQAHASAVRPTSLGGMQLNLPLLPQPFPCHVLQAT